MWVYQENTLLKVANSGQDSFSVPPMQDADETLSHPVRYCELSKWKAAVEFPPSTKVNSKRVSLNIQGSESCSTIGS